MTKMFKWSHELATIVEVTAEKPFWPNRDSDGAEIFDNTHFLDEDGAWQYGLRNAKARVTLAGGMIARIRHEVEVANKEAADAVLELSQAEEGYRKWLNRK
jgi:hypothetical protein